jgi:phosphohistidine swiveling domain-containing protein
MSPTYDLTREISETIDTEDLSKASNARLATLLIDILDFPLGEIYKLNVVQIEYGLNFAINELLKVYEPDAHERSNLLSQLISPTELTVAQQEEVAFDAILELARTRKDFELSDANKKALKVHYDEYAGKHCAYGELPPALEEYEQKFVDQVDSKELVSLAAAKEHTMKQYYKSQALLQRLQNKTLTTLCNLMSQIGVFRDVNKATLGDTVLRRIKVLNEISKRLDLKEEDIALYLTSEIVDALDKAQFLTENELSVRKEGVTLNRSDHMSVGLMSIKNLSKAEDGIMRGVCASPGTVTGSVKIIRSKEDIPKMKEGDIMVAIGTDFDLLEAMHLSSGIITEEGGLLSHASVVSRELEKPCLIGVKGATDVLFDDVEVTLNATAGSVVVH